MADYFGRIKSLTDQLAAPGQPISDHDIIIYVLAPLDNMYNAFVTPITLWEGMDLGDLYSHLLDYELRHESYNNPYQISANAAGQGQGGRGFDN